MPGKGTLVISLDFELMWGVLDHADVDTYGDRVEGGRKAIPELLRLFEKYSIHATWGVVGLIYCKDIEDMKKRIPFELPAYASKRLSSYEYMKDINNSSQDCFFAEDIIADIRGTKGQEIGSHTFSHYYCNEKGQTAVQFEQDLESDINIAGHYGDKINSIIFPRNQYNNDYEMILLRHGVKSYRGNEKAWCYTSKAIQNRGLRMMVRGARLLDAYLNIFGNHCYAYDQLKTSGVYNISSSRFFRPYSTRLKFLEPLRLRRIKSQMLHAAKSGSVCHLWWHPHNFGLHTEENMKNLTKILDYYLELKEMYGFQSLNMNEVVEYCENIDAGR